MDLLTAPFDSFGSTPLDQTSMSAAEAVPHPSSHRSDKGKGRARNDDNSDDDCQIIGIAFAESSRSSRGLSAHHRINSDHRASRSAGPTRGKGKARQQSSDTETPWMEDEPDDLTNVADPPGNAHRLRRSLTTTSGPNQQCGRFTPGASSHYEELSLKRSICEMASSPTSSPRQQTQSLPVNQACSSTSALCLPDDSGDDAPGFPLQTSLRSRHVRPGTVAHKKRRSLLRSNTSDNESGAAPSDRRSPNMSVAETSQLGGHARRASLLVNSSTRNSHSLASASTFCDSPEPLDGLTRLDQPSFDLSQRRAAFLDSTRALRSSSSIRRRRGFYIRDADLLRNDPPEQGTDPSERPSSSTSETFMAEFARAVDLRLSARSDSAQGSSVSSAASDAPRAQRQQPSRDSRDVPSQRTAPQLPYVRTASPLTVPFAAVEADDVGHTAHRGLTSESLRRRIPVHPYDRSPATPQTGPSTASSARTLSVPQLPERLPRLDDRSGTGSSRNQNFSHRYRSTNRESHVAFREAHRGAQDVALDATSALGQSEDRQLYQSDSGQQPFESQTSSNASADDFGAVLRPFGLRGARPARRARVEDISVTESDAVRQADQEHAAGLRQDHHLNTQQAIEAHNQRSSPPWRRTHFGVRAPSQLPERRASATHPRFEPFAESPRLDSRPSSDFASSRSRLSTSLFRDRHENESALEYLGRLMSHDSVLDTWTEDDVRGPLLRMAIEPDLAPFLPFAPRSLGHTAASTSNMFAHRPHLAFDARNFIADEEWAELNSYEGLMQLSEQLGAAEICVPQSLIDTLPTCEYGRWNGGSCRQREASSASPPLIGKGKGKQKVEPLASARDTMCPICREDYLDSDMLMSINKCCHAFHADCIKMWFKTAKTCPLCRADAFDDISLPALPFQSLSSSSSSSTMSRAAAASTGSSQATWTFNFEI